MASETTETENSLAFLGTGWSFPPEFANSGGYAETVSGVEDVEQSIRILASTQPGERMGRNNFGCDLMQFAFSEITSSMISDIESLISNTIKTCEPRVNLDGVYISGDEDDPGKLNIHIDYTVNNDNSLYNIVLPFYLNETQQTE